MLNIPFGKFRYLQRLRSLGSDEKLIRASNLFSEDHYISQLRGHRSPENLVRHYLLYGEDRGLSPSPLFDKDWYLCSNPDVAEFRNLFLHYVEYGEREQRSPHPLFDAQYYVSQAGGSIGRPLMHFLSAKGRTGLNPHPLLNIDRLLKKYGSEISAQDNPLVYFLDHPACEELISDRFQGRYYAAQLGELYSWPRHGLVEFLKRARREHVSPHPALGARVHSPGGLGRSRDDSAPASREVLPHIRGQRLERDFEGEYSGTVSPYTGLLAPPPPITTGPAVPSASSIAGRVSATKRDINARFRLDRAAPPRAARGGIVTET